MLLYLKENLKPHIFKNNFLKIYLQIQCNLTDISNFCVYKLTHFLWECRRPNKVRQFWQRKTNEGCTVPDIKTSCKAIETKIVQAYHQHRQTDQQTRIESPEIVPHKLQSTDLRQKSKSNSVGNKIGFSINGAETTIHPHAKQKISTVLKLFTKLIQNELQK